MASATASWTPGLDNPLIHRGRGGYLCDQARLLVGNLLWHVRRSGTLQAHIAETMSASAAGDGVQIARMALATGDSRCGGKRAKRVHAFVAHLLGMSESLVYVVQAGFDQEGWARSSVAIPAGHRHKKVRGGTQNGRRRSQCHGESHTAQPCPSTLNLQLATGNAGGNDKGHVEEVCLPALPIVDDNEVFLDSESELATGNAPLSRSQLESWRAHPNYGPAMLHAELSVFWFTAGLPDTRWAEFLAWLRAKASPGCVADINCSSHWLNEFGMSLCNTISSRTAGSLHALVPALGLPSDFVCVIDVVTVAGISTLPVVAIHTSSEGKLTYSLLGCPSVGSELASGSTERKDISGPMEQQSWLS